MKIEHAAGLLMVAVAAIAGICSVVTIVSKKKQADEKYPQRSPFFIEP